MNEELRELYQQVILDHSRRPRNFGELGAETGAVHVHGDNPSCGDEIDLWVKFDAGGGVEDVRFSGQGCAISQAAASMMTSKIKGRSSERVRALAEAYHRIVTSEEAPDSVEGMGELELMHGVRRFPQRVKCAMLAWRALEQAMAIKAEEGEGEGGGGTAGTAGTAGAA